MSNRKEDLEELYNAVEMAIGILFSQISIVESEAREIPRKEELLLVLNRSLIMMIHIKRCANFLPYIYLKSLITKVNEIEHLLPIGIRNSTEEKIGSEINNLTIHCNNLGGLTNTGYENYYYEEKTADDIENLSEIIKDLFNSHSIDYPTNLTDLAINVFTHELAIVELKDKIAQDFLEIYNTFKVNPDKSIELVKNLYIFLKETDLELRTNKFSEQVNEHTKEYKAVRENLGLKENEELINSFKSEAKSYNVPIQIYTASIISVFLIICIFIINRINHFDNKHDWHLYVFFSTVILTLSGLLTFLIRERSRIISLQTYCKKNYLELTALPNYLAELSVEQAQDLRIELAKIYFKGYEENTKNDGKESNITQLSSTLDQVVKSISEIKNIVSK